MRVTELKGNQFPLDLDLLVFEVGRRERMMCENRQRNCEENGNQNDGCGDAFHRYLAPKRGWLFLSLNETLVHGLDEHVRCIWTRCRSESGIVIFRWFRRLDLLKTHSLLDHVLDTVPNDGDHVSVVRHIGRVRQSAMSWNNHCAAFGAKFGNGQVEDAV